MFGIASKQFTAGSLSSFRLARTCRNSGVSKILRRMYIPMTISSPPTKMLFASPIEEIRFRHQRQKGDDAGT